MCDGRDFLAVLILDKSGKNGRPYTDRYNILMKGALVRALSCTGCGTWKSPVTARSGNHRIPYPETRQWMVDALRALKKRQGYVVR